MPRGPCFVDLINGEGETENRFESKSEAKHFLSAQGFQETKLGEIIASGEPFLGFFWVQNPNYTLSIVCTAFNPETGEEFLGV